MIRLSKSEEIDIRNRLDELESRLYHNIVLFEDAYWSHKIIKRLLFDIYMLQEELKRRGSG